jgi:hypothetical protein
MQIITITGILPQRASADLASFSVTALNHLSAWIKLALSKQYTQHLESNQATSQV